MRRRRLLWLTLAFVLLLLGGTLLLFSRTGLVTALVREQLAQVLRVPFQVGTTQLDLADGTLEIHDLEVLRTIGERADRLKVGSIQVLFSRSLWSLGALRRVVVRGLEVDLDLSPGRELRLLDLVRLPDTRKDAGPMDLPRIEIHDVRARVVPPDPSLPVVELRIPALTAAPLRDDPRTIIVQGDLSVPVLGTVHLEGRASSAPPSALVHLTSSDFTLRPDEAQQGSLLAGLLTEHRVDASASASVWLRWPAQPAVAAAVAMPVDALVDLDIRSLSFVPPYYRYPFRGLQGRVQCTLDDGPRLYGNLRNQGEREQARVEGTFALGPTHPIVDLDIEGQRFDITPALYQALDRDELDDAILVWDAFAPQGGEMDMHLQVQTTRERKKAQVAMDLAMRGTSVSFMGFPEDDGSRPAFPVRVADCSGRISLRPRHLVIHEATARRGTGELQACGEITALGERNQQVLDLAITASRIQIEPELRDAMAKVFKGGDTLYDEFDPHGQVDALCRLHKPAGVTQLLPTLTIHPLGASACYRGFPHKVEDVRGTVEVTREAVCFDLTAKGGSSATVAGQGRFLRVDPERSPVPMEMRFCGEGLDFSPELRGALRAVDPALLLLWDDLAPAGKGAFEFTAWKRTPDARLSFDLRSELRGCTARYGEFPVATSELRGPFLVLGREGHVTVEVQGIRGEACGGAVFVQGQFRREPDADFKVDLTSIGRGTVLTEELAQVLDQRGLFRRSLWDNFRPKGSVDAVHHITRAAGARDFASTVLVQLRGVTIAPDWLPADATNLVGELDLRNGRILTRDLTGNLGSDDTLVRCERGELVLGEDGTEVDTLFTMDNFRLTEKASRLFRGELREAYEARHIRGRLDARDLVVKVHVPREGPVVTDLTGRFTLRSGEAELGVIVRGMAGRILVTSCQLREDGADFMGRADGLSCVIAGHRFTDVQTAFTATQRSIELGELSARLYGGSVRTLPRTDSAPTALEYTFPPANDLRLRLGFKDVQLADFLAAADASGAAREYRGLVDANLEVDVPHAELFRLRGKGNLAVRNGHLGTVPIFRSIYSFIRAEKRPTFQDMSGEFAATEDGIQFPRFSLSSPFLSVDGEGRLGFDLWLDLDIAFPNLFPEAHNLFIIPLVYRWVADSLVRFRLWGYLRQLRTSPYFVLTESAPTQSPPGPILPDRQRRN